MILDSECEWIIAQAHLLDDVVTAAPGFYFQAFAESIDRLVMRAIYFIEPMYCRALSAQWLNIMIFLFR